MLNEVFGIPVKYEEWNKQGKLPLYLATGYDYQSAYINQIRCIMIAPKEEPGTVSALKKQIEQIKKVDSAPVVLCLESVSFYRRKSLIENRIPFVTEKQLYLPFMGTLLSNEKEKEQKPEKFTVSSQLLFLAYWYSHKRQICVSELAKQLPFSAMTISRAVRQLEATRLFTITKNGVNNVIESKYDREGLFKEMKQYLVSPVRQSGYIEKDCLKGNMIFAGESALSDRTMLVPPRVKTYAVYHKAFNNKEELQMKLIDSEKQVKLELWNYDPVKFSDNNEIDSISLALSLLEHTDERIEEMIEELLEKEWKKD